MAKNVMDADLDEMIERGLLAPYSIPQPLIDQMNPNNAYYMETTMKHLKLNELKVGDKVFVDNGFTCMDAGEKIVKSDKGHLYVECDAGHHDLAGQLNDDGTLSGVSLQSFDVVGRQWLD